MEVLKTALAAYFVVAAAFAVVLVAMTAHRRKDMGIRSYATGIVVMGLAWPYFLPETLRR